MDTEITLAGPTDLAGFRSEARQLLAHQIAPGTVHWHFDVQGADPFRDVPPPQSSRPRNVARAATAIVPASFARLCEFVVLHRDPERFGLLYRLLWRLVHEPGLRNDTTDADMVQAQHMAHAVRRDLHKMKANMRLDAVGANGDTLLVGCYEPTHHVLESAALWFAKRIDAARWAIFTPERSVYGEHGVLHFGPGVDVKAMPSLQAGAAAWNEVVARVFARPHA